MGARVQSEEMLPQMINTKPFLLHKMCFLLPGVVAAGFFQVGLRMKGQQKFGGVGTIRSHQLGEWEEAKERGPGGASLAERITASAVCLGESSGRHSRGLEPLEL